MDQLLPIIAYHSRPGYLHTTRLQDFDNMGQIVETAPPDEFFTNAQNERTLLFLSKILSH